MLISFFLGISLSAAAGFRIFIPLLVMSISSLTGILELSSGFEWIGSYPAMITFAVASVVEIIAYYIPFVDNLLDTIAAPAAVIAGVIISASTIIDINPYLKWILAIIAGGGAAGIIQGTSTITRGASTVSTGGIGNPVVSTAEIGGAVTVSVLAVFFPVVIGIVILLLLYWGINKIYSFKKKSTTIPGGTKR